MRLTHLRIEGFRQFRRLEIEFGPGNTVVAGLNASGKSNLMEAIVLIFDCLNRQVPPPFSFMVSYERAGQRVEVSATENSPFEEISFVVNGTRTSHRDFYPRGRKRLSPLAEKSTLLPSRVFLYSSSERHYGEHVFWPYRRRFRSDLRRSDTDVPLPSLLLAKPIHGQFATLLYGLSHQPEAGGLAGQVGFQRIGSLLLELRCPRGFKGLDAWWQSIPGRPGKLVEFLREGARTPIRQRQKVDLPDGKSEVVEVESLFLGGATILPSIERWYVGQNSRSVDIFRDLEALDTLGFLHNIAVNVDDDNRGSVDSRALSDGERQLLTVIGFLIVARENESLLLLDEADTHLNPGWSQVYLKQLDLWRGAAESHVIVSTNDPMVVANAARDAVILLRRHEDGTSTASHPLRSPRGMGINALLTSEFFGLQTPLDASTQADLARKWELAAQHHLTETELGELGILEDRLWKSGLLLNDRDPLFREFQEALLREGGPPRSLLTPAEQAERNTVADRVLRLIREGNRGVR